MDKEECGWNSIPTEVQFQIFDLVQRCDYSSCLATFRLFPPYVKEIIDKGKWKPRCKYCKLRLDKLQWMNKRVKMKFCCICGKGACDSCIKYNKYSDFLLDEQGSFCCITDDPSTCCNDEWWKPFYLQRPSTHGGIFCKGLENKANLRSHSKEESDKCLHLINRLEPGQKIYNKDVLTYRVVVKDGGCKYVSYSHSSEAVPLGEEWLLPPIHNIEVYESTKYDQQIHIYDYYESKHTEFCPGLSSCRLNQWS